MLEVAVTNQTGVGRGEWGGEGALHCTTLHCTAVLSCGEPTQAADELCAEFVEAPFDSIESLRSKQVLERPFVILTPTHPSCVLGYETPSSSSSPSCCFDSLVQLKKRKSKIGDFVHLVCRCCPGAFEQEPPTPQPSTLATVAAPLWLCVVALRSRCWFWSLLKKHF